MTEPLLIAKAKEPLYLLPKMANRHGLIAGATGTGKTVTLQVMAERFSAIGVPVFMADVKGDLAGISQKGGGNAKVEERVKQMKPEGFEYQGFPVTFWDVFGEQGHPVRTTVSEMGPLLLARLLNDYNLEIGAGLGALAGKIVRIGLMGYGANMKNVMYCLEALEAVLADMRAPIQTGVAMNAAQNAAVLN